MKSFHFISSFIMDDDIYFGDQSNNWGIDLDDIFNDDQANDENYQQDQNDIENGEISSFNPYLTPLNAATHNNESNKKINQKKKESN